MSSTMQAQIETIINETLVNTESVPDEVDSLVEKLSKLFTDNTKKPAKRTTKPKKPVDPAAPKKSDSAYQAFCKKFREEIKQELEANSGDTKISMIDVTRELGARWKKLQVENPEEYQVYLKTAEQEKVEYIEKLEEYEDSDGYKAFIESDEYKVWEAFQQAAKEAKEKAKNAIPYEHKVKTEDQIKSAYALFQNEYLQQFVREYQEEIGIPAAKKAFSELWKVHNKKDNRGNPITDDNKFTIEKTAQDYIDEYEPIKAARTSNDDNNSDAGDLTTVTVQSDDDEEDVLTGCSHVNTRGKRKGKYCNKTCFEDSDKCRSHKLD